MRWVRWYAYADYRPLRAAAPDEVGLQADIQLIRSPDGGATWSAPVRVNQDETNADQFQRTCASPRAAS